MPSEAAVSDQQDKGPRRRRRAKCEGGPKKKPIRLVSSLGEGKLLDRFQSTLNEKETKKKLREKSEIERKFAKEKREREIAKFQEEINALLEDKPEPVKSKNDSNKIFVPKLSGTVKGKFEALEQKKQQEEKSKMEHERKKRQDRDFREKKRIQIEIAKKKKQLQDAGEKDDAHEESFSVGTRRKPGKITNNFEKLAERKQEKEKKKLEMERKLKISSEIRAVKEYYSNQNTQDSDGQEELISPKPAPGKLKKNFDEVFRSQEEQRRRHAEEEKRQKLEEEKQQMRAAKLAGGDDSEEEEGVSSQSQSSSCEKFRPTPNRLSASFTKFDEIEKQRLEDERKAIREQRKALLEEEKRLFEQSKRSLQDDDENEEQMEPNETNVVTSPGRLDSSLTKFDIITQQKFEEERQRIYKERQRLLEEENQNFKKEQMRLKNQQDDKATTDSESLSNESASDESPIERNSPQETRSKKMKKRRKKTKHVPSKLDYSKLKFDVLERRRMENESLQIQQERQKLLNDEKKLFEEARRQQQIQNENEDDGDTKENHTTISPGRLDPTRTKFDVMTKQKLEEERERIRSARMKLMEEEKKLMEEERNKLKMQEIEEEENLEDSFAGIDDKDLPKPQKLNKSFTQFDIMEKRRKQMEIDALFKEKAKKLEEEKKSFQEARANMDASSEEDDSNVEISNEISRKPSKLSKKFTNFDLAEQERVKRERLAAHEDRIRKLENEVKSFEKERNEFHDSDDDITSGTKALLKSSRDSPRPRKLAASFTKFDVMEQKRREEEREKLQKEKARRLEEERKLFERSRLEAEQNESSAEEENGRDSREDYIRDVKRMNVRSKIEAVMKAQEEAEKKRIEETKFCRMTVEQQEMFLARERQINFLKEQLARAKAEDYSNEYSESDGSDEEGEYYYYYTDEDEDEENGDLGSSEEEIEEGDEYAEKRSNEGSETKSTVSEGASSNGSGAYSGAPYFVQTLSNLCVKEGEPVRFDANINANPHPKVTWYFKNRAIRNSADYQYINKGTQYSLYMTESFVDDSGEFMCKAVNDKGTATSKAMLNVTG